MEILFFILFFFHKLKDKAFKVKYFLEYVIVSFITGKAIVFVVNSISEQGSEGRVGEVLAFALVATFLACYLEGFLYQTFKKISHKNNQ